MTAPTVERLDPPDGSAELERIKPSPSSWIWQHSIAERFATTSVSAVPVGTPAATDAQFVAASALGEQRTRLGTQLQFKQERGFVRELVAAIEGELTTPELSKGIGNLWLRKGYLEATTLAGRLSAGRMTSTWGLGILAQAGDDDALQFGFRRAGNLVNRVQYAFLPAGLVQKTTDLSQIFPLIAVVAYDQVVRDDLVLYPGDTARNAVGALLYRGKDLQAGIYGVMRDQTDNAGLTLQANIVDGFFSYHSDCDLGTLGIAAEGVMVKGTTTWLRTPSQPDSLNVLQYGGVARLEMKNPWLQARLETGLASGDSAPFDNTIRNFKFTSDYRIGLVLFPQVMRIQAEQTRRNLSDPRLVGQGPAGAERILTDGSVSQAMYIAPIVRATPHPRWAFLAGGVLAHAPVDVAEPYQTYMAGGVATGSRGSRNKRDLGIEFDGAVEFNYPLFDEFSAIARVDGGVWLPGGAFDDAAGVGAAAVGAIQGQLSVRGVF